MIEIRINNNSSKKRQKVHQVSIISAILSSAVNWNCQKPVNHTVFMTKDSSKVDIWWGKEIEFKILNKSLGCYLLLSLSGGLNPAGN